MHFNWKTLSAKSKILIFAAIGWAGSAHVDKVKNVIVPIVSAHPKWSFAASSLIFIIGVIQNPIAREVLTELGLSVSSQNDAGNTPAPPIQ